MQTEEHNNGQRSPPSVPKTGPYLQRTIRVLLGCQMINGINPTDNRNQEQQNALGECMLPFHTESSPMRVATQKYKD
jgi:hypothetical protein